MRLNEPDAVYQSFADEVIAINLSLGKYYSLGKAGADAFLLIVSGVPSDDVPAVLAERWGVPLEDVTRDLIPLLESLVREGLVAEGGEVGYFLFQDPPSLPYEAPSLETYDEMQALLLLDPIHDVDELGWPNKKSE